MAVSGELSGGGIMLEKDGLMYFDRQSPPDNSIARVRDLCIYRAHVGFLQRSIGHA